MEHIPGYAVSDVIRPAELSLRLLQIVYLPGPRGRRLSRSRATAITLAFSRRLQIQERLTHQVAAGVSSELQASGVLVLCRYSPNSLSPLPPPFNCKHPAWIVGSRAFFLWQSFNQFACCRVILLHWQGLQLGIFDTCSCVCCLRLPLRDGGGVIVLFSLFAVGLHSALKA